MRLIPHLIIAAAALASPVMAAQTVAVPKFKAIELRGGGKLVLRHGPQQRVTLVSGSTNYTSLEVSGPSTRRVGNVTINNSGESLVITACRAQCPRGYSPTVEVVSPDISAIAVSGGGNVEARGSFPRQSSLGISASGGAVMDVRSMAADSVGASASGGGVIRTRPMRNLGDSASGGGQIIYWGDPSVGISTSGGGSVRRGG